MGNRAVITTEKEEIGVYLHWHGGRDSVEAFLAVCKKLGHRSPESDCYGMARLCQVIGNFFGGTTSLGVDKVGNLDCDNGDNGMYIIRGWEIIGRKFFNNRSEQKGYELASEQKGYELAGMIKDIEAAQPQPKEETAKA